MKKHDLPEAGRIKWLTAAFGLLLIICLWGGLHYKVETERKLEIENAIKDTSTLAIALEENTVRTIKGLDQIVMFLKIEYEKNGKNIDIPKYIHEGRFNDQPYLLLSVVDENGDMVASSQEPFRSTNLKDREPFQVHESAECGLHISKPVLGKVTGKWAIQLTRRISKADGSFGGFVAVAADPYYFAEFYKKVNLGGESSVALVGLDGVLRVRQSGETVQVGLDFSSRVKNEFNNGGNGFFIDKSIVDEKMRIYSFRTMQEYPLVVAVGESEETVLHDFRQRVKSYYFVCGGMSVFIILFCLMLLRGMARRQAAESELCKLSTRLTLATSIGGVGVWEYDVLNDLFIWDEQMFNLYGVGEGSFPKTYKEWLEALHPDDRWLSDFEMQRALSGEQAFNTEFRVCWPDGSIHTIRALSNVERDRNGKALRMIGTNWDITSQKETEHKLKETNHKLGQSVIQATQLMQAAEAANVAKSSFLANMSHEIRTPMNGVLGFLQLLESTKLSSEQTDFVQMMRKSADLLLSIISDVLDLSKIEAGKLQLEEKVFDLPALIYDAVAAMSALANEKKLELNVWVDEATPNFVIGDSFRLKQILTNFLSNALKFTEQGEVLVEALCVEKNDGFAELRLAVSDTGIGISKEVADKLFQPFVQADGSSTRKFGGTGLGLVISKSIIEMMGGKIGVTSEAEKGSTFFVTLRLKTEEREKLDTSVDLRGKTIFIVAENHNCRSITARYLETAGAKAIEAENGMSALAGLMQSPAVECDLIIAAMQMADMSGEDLAAALQAIPQTRKIPFIFLMKKSSVWSEEYLMTPCSRQTLLERVALILQREDRVLD